MSDEEAESKMNPRVDQEGLEVFFLYDCPSCGTNRHPMRGLKSGTVLTCRCGDSNVTLEGDGADTVQRGLDDIKRSFDSLGDAFKKFGR
jgi:hypothetical protein